MFTLRSPAITAGGGKVPQNSGLFSEPFRRINFVDNVFISSTLVISQADPQIGYVDQLGNMQLQANGIITSFAAPTLGTRFSVVADPDNAAKKAWLFKCANTDADTAGAGAKRTEFSSYPDQYTGFPEGREFLACFATRTGQSWSGLTDEQLISQIHASSGSPIFAIYVNGSGLRISIRRGEVGSAEVILYVDSMFVAQMWDSWVIYGKPGQPGFLKVWRNGALVVNYSGNFGYTDGSINYLKAGYYHWTNAGNTWDTNLTERTLYYKGPWIIEPSRDTLAEALQFIASA